MSTLRHLPLQLTSLLCSLFLLLVRANVGRQVQHEVGVPVADDLDACISGQCAMEMLQFHAGMRLASNHTLRPPVAKRVPFTVRVGKVKNEPRGENPMDPPKTLVDNYFWIRDDERRDEKVLDLLFKENAYTDAQMRRLNDFQGDLYKELLSHVQEDDDSYPMPSGDGYEYWIRYVKGKPFPQYMRRIKGGTGEGKIILDENEVCESSWFVETPGWKTAQCQVASVTANPSGDLFAYSIDGSGIEQYNIRFRDMTRGVDLKEQINYTGGEDLTWIDDSTLLYRKGGAILRHEIGISPSKDVEVFHDPDPEFGVGCGSSRDRSNVFIWAKSRETTEMYLIPTRTPKALPRLIRKKQHGVRYDLSSHEPSRSLFLVSNIDGKVNQELLVASLDSPSKWKPVLADGVPVLPHSTSRSLDGVFSFFDFLVVSGREDGFTQFWVVPLIARSGKASGQAHRMAFPFEEKAFMADLAPTLFKAQGKIRVRYSSMKTPPTLLEYDIHRRKYQVLKVWSAKNFDPKLYKTKRAEVIARDGVVVPVTLLWRPDAVGRALEAGGGGAPCHLYGYGSYGMPTEPSFNRNALPLVDRGIVYALAHVRGGGEMGYHKWYEASGKDLKKRNTFNDFVDVAKGLVKQGIAKKGAISCEGHSAGGMLVGNAINMAPDLFVAVYTQVPFVDVIVSMCDPTVPLSMGHWGEWGNPNLAKYYDYMMSYSVIQNVRKGVSYPSMLILSGLNDMRVGYWESAKWAQVLRARIDNGKDIFLSVNLDAGHMGIPDRYSSLSGHAYTLAWLLDKLGKADVKIPQQFQDSSLRDHQLHNDTRMSRKIVRSGEFPIPWVPSSCSQGHGGGRLLK